MLNSVKSKIIIITLSIFVLFNIAILSLQINNYFNYKELKIENFSNKVGQFNSFMNANILQIESNAKTLSLDGAAFYYYKLQPSYLDFIIHDNFNNNNTIAGGGGVWFEPFMIKNQKKFSSFASLTNNEVQKVTESNSEEYDYLNQSWYLYIKDNYDRNRKDAVYWSAPYYDEIGGKKLMVTAGTAIYDEKLNFIGMSTVDWFLETIIERIDDLAPTKGSIVVFADKVHDFIIALDEGKDSDIEFTGKSLNSLKWYNEDLKDTQIININKIAYRTFITNFDNGMVLIVNIPVNEIYGKYRNNILWELFAQIIGTILLAYLIYGALTKNINKPIQILVDATKEIGKGNFDSKIDIKKPKEFVLLANTINTMTTDIKEYTENIKNLTFEKEQMEKDLMIAKEIQTSSIPNVFPPFPDLITLDLYASMHTAKQVGGDFYDFYFIDHCHVVFTIADVSGKGIPAALFMMKAKSLLKSVALSNPIVETIMQKVNNNICENNDNGFFVTVGMGIIDFLTGEVVYINAGHNPPILKTKEKIEYLTVPNNLVLGVIEDVQFKIAKFKLEPLDTIFLYTDGVTEASNKDNNLYGEERLLNIIKQQNSDPKEIINNVKNDVDKFVNGFEQSDDITMLALTYLGVENVLKKIHFPAEVNELAQFLAWLENLCNKCGVDKSKISKLLIAAEEIFVNIAYYAYPNEQKQKMQETTIIFKYIKPLNEINLIFSDSGVPYNPLEKEDPDINQGLEERKAGGMGIYMVKNMMDNVTYEYKNKQNILTIKCNLTV